MHTLPRPFRSFILPLLIASTFGALAQDEPPKWGGWAQWGDQGDGTYRNPVLPADYSDLDCIRVGADFYAISSTFQFSPGMVILHSRDLVNWQIISHAVPAITQIEPELNWDRMDRSGRGIWAGSIRYARKRFWIYFGTADEGYFMTSAPSITGPWAPLHCLLKGGGWDDCCPFFDDDGQAYFIGTHYADDYTTYLWKLTPDGRDLLPASKTKVNQGAHREANKLLKINGLYYHFFSEVMGARVCMMQRSKAILGPYTERRQLTDQNRAEKEPNQGGLVDNGRGDWFFLTHHGTGAWEGRAASLLPVAWIDGWPIIGHTDRAGSPGRMAWAGPKPVAGEPITIPQTSDEFTTATLGLQWEWNYAPRADKWSLTEKPGFLRLKAFRPLAHDQLLQAGNTLTQRSFRTRASRVTLQLHLHGMADGQKAGLCHFAGTHSALGVAQEGSTRRLELRVQGQLTPGPELPGDDLWLRSSWGLDGQSQYSYSLDGKTFTDFGAAYLLTWGHYRGDRLGIYSFNNKADAGYVDADFFHYDLIAPGRPAP